PLYEHPYDAVYLLALSYMAAGNSIAPRDIKGSDLVKGLTKLNPPGLIEELRADNIPNLNDKLVQGEDIDVRGPGGELDFAIPQLNWPPQPISLQCIKRGKFAASYLPTGLIWQDKMDPAVSGDFTPCPGM